jgi:hypothetical protein
MPFGFRKSFKLAPGVRLNVSKRSIGLGAGPRGAKLSANSRGQRRVGLSLGGLFWRKRL